MSLDVKFRTDTDHVPGVRGAQHILGHLAGGSVGSALSHLDIGIDEAGAREYLDRPLKALMTSLPVSENPDWVYERMLTIAIGFALVAVEAERERVRLEEPVPTATLPDEVSGDPTQEQSDEHPPATPAIEF